MASSMRWRTVLPLLALAAGCGMILLVGLTSAVEGAHALPAPATPAISTSRDGVPPAIQATVRRASLAVTLSVAPVDVGAARFVAAVRDHGRPLLGAPVRMQLSMPAWLAAFGTASLPARPCGGAYCASGSLQALGRWRVVVEVQGPGAAPARIVPFDLMNGANARFLFAQPADPRFGPATAILTQHVLGASILRVLLRPGLQVRAVLSMPNMPTMGSAGYAARPSAGGWYAASLRFAMTGVNQILIQVGPSGRWVTARTLLYDVDGSGRADLLTNTP